MQKFLLCTKLFAILNVFSLVSSVSGVDSRSTSSSLASPNALDCEMSFGSLDGTDVRIGFITVLETSATTTMTSFVDEIKAVLKVCGSIHPDDVVEETVSSVFDIPITAKFLAMSEDVDVIIIITNPNGSRFTIETDATSVAVMHGIMDIGLHYNVPIVFGNNISRNSYSNTYKSSYEIGKTALKMALMRWEAMAFVGYEQERSGVVYVVGTFAVLLFLVFLFGIIIKKRGIITDKKAIFAKIMCFRKEYDKVDETETVPATLA